MTSQELEIVAREVCEGSGLEYDRYVGEGTFKVTFHVRGAGGSSLALKVFKPGFSPERTVREIDAMRQFDHPNIGQLLDIGEFTGSTGKYLFAVEEFLSGGTLTDRIKSGLLSRESVLALGRPLISAVQAISARELVHRDLKPDNIMFRSDGITPVIVDFGIVRDLSNFSLTHSFLPQGPCTPYFAAPEQLTNTKELIDWKTDQFALGILLSISASGFHPYEEEGDEISALYERVATRGKQSKRFLDWVNKVELPALIRMTDPWPVYRYRTPEGLLEAWNSHPGGK